MEEVTDERTHTHKERKLKPKPDGLSRLGKREIQRIREGRTQEMGRVEQHRS